VTDKRNGTALQLIQIIFLFADSELGSMRMQKHALPMTQSSKIKIENIHD
jgi:hypothetical protein